MPALRFAINHITAPALPVSALLELTRRLGLDAVEIRNDLPGVPLQDGSPAAPIAAAARDAGVTILSVNALQRFEDWSDARATEAVALADQARDSGARALVLVPTNSQQDTRSAEERAAGLRRALAALKPILGERGLTGLVEPLGFAECALRRKRLAVEAIDAIDGAALFSLVHDTFHHYVAGEAETFPDRTGLVHISGVEDASLPREAIRDAHRVLVGPGDLMDNIGQIRALFAAGYTGPLSFEPFAESVHRLTGIAAALSASIRYVRACLG